MDSVLNKPFLDCHLTEKYYIFTTTNWPNKFSKMNLNLTLWIYLGCDKIDWLLSERTTMWSWPVVLTEWENENDSQNQWELPRITINTIIFMHLCHLVLDHWKTLFYVILGDSQWFANQSEIVLGWFLVIHKPLWKHFWGNSWWFSVICKPLWKHFWGNSWWFSVICKPLWKHFWGYSHWFLVILCDSLCLTNQSEFFGAILSDSWWFANHSEWKHFWGDSWQFSVILESVWNCLGAILGDSQTTLKTFLGWFSVVLGDSHWFTNQSFGVILGDSWTTLKTFLGNSQWFSMIHKSVWNCFGVNDSQTTLKTFWGDSQQFLVILNDSWWFVNQLFRGDCWWLTNLFWGWFSVILGDNQ